MGLNILIKNNSKKNEKINKKRYITKNIFSRFNSFYFYY